jgi:hypothetical protein
LSGSPVGSDDYSDLDFDVEKHREAIRVFTAYGFDEATVRAGLRARDVVSVRITSGKFGIGVTDDLGNQEESQKAQGCVAFEVIHQSRSADEVQQVRAAVERYFRRHFPGRCLDRSGEAPLSGSDHEKYVYVALHG